MKNNLVLELQGVSKVRGHFNKSVLHSDFFYFSLHFPTDLKIFIFYQFSELFYEADKKPPWNKYFPAEWCESVSCVFLYFPAIPVCFQ